MSRSYDAASADLGREAPGGTGHERPLDGLPPHGGPYERIEICLCCIVWPTVAVASAVLLYWLLLDDLQRTGWFTRAASTVFVAVFVVSVMCSIDVWSRLIVELVRRLRGPGGTVSP